jgi:hypothetical protein
MGQFLDDPVALVVFSLVAAGVVAYWLWRWRQTVALRRRAEEQGWQPAGDPGAFGDLVIAAAPELREQAEQDARSAARSGGGPGAGPGLRVRVGPSPSSRSRVRADDVRRIPVRSGEVAAGNVAVAARVGKVAGGSTTLHRGAVLARAPVELPDVRFISRSWMDRDGGGDLPDALTETFNDQTLDAGARAVYLDSGAWEVLLGVADDVDALVISDQTVVVVCSGPLTVDRVEVLVAAVSDFVERAIRAQLRGEASGPVRLLDPLPAG